MSEKFTVIHESVSSPSAQECFAKYGHVALANAYDAEKGPLAADLVFRRSRLRHNDRISGQTGEVRYTPGQYGDPIADVITGAIQTVDQLDDSAVSLADGKIRAQVIDHAPGATGTWHRDLGIIVTTLKGTSLLEIEGENGDPDTAYELTPGRIVVMNPTRRLRHRGVAGTSSPRTGLAIERMR